MEAAWRFRIMLVMAIAVIIFGDILGYGNAKDDRTPAITNSAALAQPTPQIYLDDVDSFADNELDSNAGGHKGEQRTKKFKILSQSIKEHCLPKLLCEIAAKSPVDLTEQEKNIMEIIRSTTLSLVLHSAPTRWHFASHMGQLMRYTGDRNSGPLGCANLWPQCPFSSKKLLQLTSNVILK